MSVLKIGSASTLDIIAGVKARLPAIEATLPPGVKLTFVGDQSAFVKSSVTAAARAGPVAGPLPGLPTLRFFRPWRPTPLLPGAIPPAGRPPPFRPSPARPTILREAPGPPPAA